MGILKCECFHSGEMTDVVFVHVSFVLLPIAEIKEEEKTKDIGAEKTESKR